MRAYTEEQTKLLKEFEIAKADLALKRQNFGYSLPEYSDIASLELQAAKDRFDKVYKEVKAAGL